MPDSGRRRRQIVAIEEDICIRDPRPGEFGLDDKVLVQLPLDAGKSTFYDALVKSNKTFAATTKKKDYGTHVTKGRRTGQIWETEVPVPDRTRSFNRGSNGQGRRSRK